jgi:hypothetical protein
MGKMKEGQPVVSNPPSNKRGDLQKGMPVVPNRPQPQAPKPQAPKQGEIKK